MTTTEWRLTELRQLAEIYVEAERDGRDNQALRTLELAKTVIDEMGLGFVNTKLFLMSYAPHD